jgi:malate dehydrogenase (oxaloacetate-decarboxylating)
MAAAKALAEISLRTKLPDGKILPPVSALRNVAFQVARAVRLTAIEEGLAPDVGEAALARRIDGKMWTPAYASYARSR